MNYKQFNVALPIRDNNVQIVDGIVQYDTANIFNVRLMDGVEPFDFTGYTEVYIEILKPDGTHVQSCITDDPEVNSVNNPYSIQVVDAKEGRLSFTLHGQATILPNSHFMHIMIAGGGRILTTAKLNYYVGGSLMDATVDLTSNDEYASLLTLINRNSLISDKEELREDSEAKRIVAEALREERMTKLEGDVAELIASADERLEASKEAAMIAQDCVAIVTAPSKEVLARLIEELNLAEKQYVDGLTKNFDAGLFTDDDETKRLLKVRTGTASELPELVEGELGYATDTKRLYVGDVPINGVYHVGEVAPAETHVLWLDTASGGVIKYYDGIDWQPAATVAFS